MKRKGLSAFGRFLIVLFFVFLTGCTTQGKFVAPPGTEISLHERAPIPIPASGIVESKPFFWTAAGVPPAGGLKYKLMKDGKVLKQGKLRVKFRIVSIFWPPFAAIYWPMGMNPDITYDLIKGTQQ